MQTQTQPNTTQLNSTLSLFLSLSLRVWNTRIRSQCPEPQSLRLLCWKMNLTSWSPRSETSTSSRCGGLSSSHTISSLFRTVTPVGSSRSPKASTMSSTIATISTGFSVPKPLAFPSRTLLAVASATWSPRRSTSTPSMMIALWVVLFFFFSFSFFLFCGVLDVGFGYYGEKVRILMWIFCLFLGFWTFFVNSWILILILIRRCLVLICYCFCGVIGHKNQLRVSRCSWILYWSECMDLLGFWTIRDGIFVYLNFGFFLVMKYFLQ